MESERNSKFLEKKDRTLKKASASGLKYQKYIPKIPGGWYLHSNRKQEEGKEWGQ